MNRLTASIIALALSGSAAIADGPTPLPADPLVTPPPPPSAPMAYDWTGGYAGLGLTYGTSSHSLPGPATLPDTNGAGLSGLAGYNWQSGSAVFGAEIAGIYARLNGTADCFNPTYECSSRVNHILSARGRLGVAQDRTLFFVSAGLASGNFTHRTDDGIATFTDTRNAMGAMVGVGIEQAMSNGWNIRGDIEHYQFRRQDFGLDSPYDDVRARVTLGRISAIMRF